MRRREIIALLGSAAFAWPLVALAQQNKLHRIALFSFATPVSEMRETGARQYGALLSELRRLGYIEDQNLVIERYSGEGRTEGFADLAREIVRHNPDLIFAAADRLASAVKIATVTIPVVTVVSDPVALGIAASLARPGGNITGATIDADVVGTFSRRLDFLHEMVPTASSVGFLAARTLWESQFYAGFKEAAQRINISLVGPPLAPPFEESEYHRVFAAMGQQRVEALLVSAGAENIRNRRLIVELAEKYRLPASYWYREFADIGGLMVYGIDLPDIFRHAADQVDMILKGATPADIPFYQPTKFTLTINLKAAKALGITVPPTLLIAADEIIE